MMNCHEFQSRLDRILDERGDFTHDSRLLEHAEECDCCRQSLELWQGIDFALQSSAGQTRRVAPRGPLRMWSAISALAAATLLLVFAGSSWESVPWNADTDRQGPLAVRSLDELVNQPEPMAETTAVASAFPPEAIVAVFDGVRRPLAVKSDAEAQALWGTLQSDRWMAHTMPAVNSVREGVAPISRSVRRALAILLTDGQETNLQDSVSPGDVPTGATKEQAYDALESERLATIA